MTTSLTAMRVRGEAQTRQAAARLAEQLLPGTLLALEGELGAGKTVFVRGLAAALGHDPERISSPSYVLAVEWRAGRVGLLHVDLYRLADGAGIEELGIEDALAAGQVVAVEWAQRLPHWLAARAWRVLIVHPPGAAVDERLITVLPPRSD